MYVEHEDKESKNQEVRENQGRSPKIIKKGDKGKPEMTVNPLKYKFELSDFFLKEKIFSGFNTFNWDQLSERTERNLAALSVTTISLSFQTTWRLLVGIGTASVLNTGMTLHPVYGIPYIPGSGIKGMLRTFILTECFDAEVEKAFQNAVFVSIFGSEDDTKEERYSAAKGKTLFMDAFPTAAPKIVRDIMNPHFGKYYVEGEPPADTGNPVPIFFLTLKDTTFRFLIGLKSNPPLSEFGQDWKKVGTGKLMETDTLSDLIQVWLIKALTENGIGAKTAVGYGRMNPIQ